MAKRRATGDPPEVAAYLDGLRPERRATVERFHRVIRTAVPDLDVRMWDYGGGLIGYGTHPYRTRSGLEGDWFALGVGDRARYVSLFSTATRDDAYLTEAYADRMPGTKQGRSCFNITKPELLDDAVIAELARETAAAFADQLR